MCTNEARVAWVGVCIAARGATWWQTERSGATQALPIKLSRMEQKKRGLMQFADSAPVDTTMVISSEGVCREDRIQVCLVETTRALVRIEGDIFFLRLFDAENDAVDEVRTAIAACSQISAAKGGAKIKKICMHSTEQQRSKVIYFLICLGASSWRCSRQTSCGRRHASSRQAMMSWHSAKRCSKRQMCELNGSWSRTP